MKKVNKLFLLVLGFVAGLLSGTFIRLGFEILNGYPRAIGGEALIMPLIIVLICFGFPWEKRSEPKGKARGPISGDIRRAIRRVGRTIAGR